LPAARREMMRCCCGVRDELGEKSSVNGIILPGA
jgi:hypothetical protein